MELGVHQYLEYRARTTPTRVCIDDGIRRWTYAEADGRANAFAHALGVLGILPGDRVGVLAKNRIEWVAIYYGCFKAGVIPVPLNVRLHPAEWAYILNDSGARAVVAAGEYRPGLDGVRGGLIKLEHCLCLDGGAEDWIAYDEFVDRQRSGPLRSRLEDSGPLYQMYTSGTTGAPKGVVITHRAVVANIAQIMAAMQSPGGRTLIVMPLFHCGAAVSTFAFVAMGHEIRLMGSFDPADCVRALDDDIVTAAFVPAMIQAMLSSVPDVRSRRYEALTQMTYGASSIAEETLRQAMEVFGCDFYQAFGMTETTAILTMLLPEDHRRALAGRPELLASCGRPVVGTKIRIVDDADHEVSVGRIGEIVARGPQLMQGYWRLPEATEWALREGWMHTGDVGYVDHEGYVFICDRLTDMIISGGENIYPREIEDVLFQLPAVADAAVIGVPDERWGETPKAIVSRKVGAQLTEQEVIAWCASRLATFKAPRSVDFVDTIPRNPAGKVLKKDLRAPYWAGRARSV